MSLVAYVSESDFRLSGRLQGWKPPRWLRLWMLWATRLGDGWIWILTGLALAAGGSDYHRVLAAAAVSAGVANTALVVLKRRVKRRRPSEYAPQICGVACPQLLAFDEFSFPSGHALNAFAIGTVLALAVPALAPAVLVIAGSIAASRAILGHHFVGDVVAGAALGSLIGGSAYAVFLA